jgi:dTDP-4-dehydrorhamnose reductase
VEINSKSILIVGGDSKIGRALTEHFERSGHLVTKTTRRVRHVQKNWIQLDLDRPDQFQCKQGFDFAFICAGQTNISQCEKRPEETAQINTHNTIQVIEKLSENGTFIIFLSSNVVFSGLNPKVPSTEEPSAICHYGKQKVRVENYLLENCFPAAVVRLTKVVGTEFPLLKDWAQSLIDGENIVALSDLNMAPISMESLIAACSNIAKKRSQGIFHLSGPEDVSYAQVGAYIALKLGIPGRQVKSRTSDEAGINIYYRPKHTTLDTKCAEDTLQFRPEHWSKIVDQFIESTKAQIITT